MSIHDDGYAGTATRRSRAYRSSSRLLAMLMPEERHRHAMVAVPRMQCRGQGYDAAANRHVATAAAALTRLRRYDTQRCVMFARKLFNGRFLGSGRARCLRSPAVTKSNVACTEIGAHIHEAGPAWRVLDASYCRRQLDDFHDARQSLPP